MYEKHFGLKTKPFGSKAEGSGVFVGPRQASMISSLHKGLGAPDAVVTVTGPVGVGKSTIVDHALETMPTGRTAARVGRMHLTQEEVVDLLMGGFGIKKTAGGSIRRYAAFRRILQQQRENNIPVAIVIEDAQKLGTDALAEVEALTAADAGDAASANIILMGQPGLHDVLMTPDLGRLKQRVRIRLKAEALTAAEVQGYLKHTIREAGGDYDAIFDANVADIVFGCSEGILRVINTLCETAMTTAMEENSVRVTATLMSQVARDAYGYESEPAEIAVSPAVADIPLKAPVEEDIDWEAPATSPATEIDEDPAPREAVPEASAIGHDMIVESGSYPTTSIQPDTLNPTEAEPQTAVEPVNHEVADTNAFQIPELINDTQPELPRLDTPVLDSQEDIPVLNPQHDDSDIESTQTLAQPIGILVDEAVGNNSEAADVESEGASEDDAGEHFDLDAALSPEVEATNVMPGLTTNLDAVALDKAEPTVVQKVLEPAIAPVPEPVVEAKSEPEPDPEPTAIEMPVEVDLPTLSDSMRVDVKKEVARAIVATDNTEPESAPALAPDPAPDTVAAPEPAATQVETPELEPEPRAMPESIPQPELVSEPEPEPEPEPEVFTEPAPVISPEAAIVSAPPPLREPLPPSDATMNAPAMRNPSPVVDAANRQSDIDALEAALAAAKNGELAAQKEPHSLESVNGTTPESQTEGATADVPEITLDEVIADQQSQLAKLDQLRDEMGDVNSLEDVTDVMAETLFGVEFEELAAAAIADPNPPEGGYGPDNEIAPSPVKLAEDELPVAANDAAELKLEQTGELAEPPASNLPNEGSVALNESTSLRIDMLNAMKTKAAAMAENVELGSDDPADRYPEPKGPQPEPIERQINTSMTQTLEALNVSKVAGAAIEEDKEEKKSGGLFSRFRKSS